MEFVSHITRSFAVSTKPTRLERAKEATISMGSAVSGRAAAGTGACCRVPSLTPVCDPRCSPAWP